MSEALAEPKVVEPGSVWRSTRPGSERTRIQVLRADEPFMGAHVYYVPLWSDGRPMWSQQLGDLLSAFEYGDRWVADDSGLPVLYGVMDGQLRLLADMEARDEAPPEGWDEDRDNDSA